MTEVGQVLLVTEWPEEEPEWAKKYGLLQPGDKIIVKAIELRPYHPNGDKIHFYFSDGESDWADWCWLLKRTVVI